MINRSITGSYTSYREKPSIKSNALKLDEAWLSCRFKLKYFPDVKTLDVSHLYAKMKKHQARHLRRGTQKRSAEWRATSIKRSIATESCASAVAALFSTSMESKIGHSVGMPHAKNPIKDDLYVKSRGNKSWPKQNFPISRS